VPHPQAWSDVIITTSDSKQLHLHGTILAQKIPYFSDGLFPSELKKDNKLKFELELPHESSSLKLFFEHIYNDEQGMFLDALTLFPLACKNKFGPWN
jgi:BTB/POZ domain